MDDHLQEPWHAKLTEDVLRLLKTSEDGLSDAEAEKRLQKDGYSALCQKKQKSIPEMLKEQLTDAMILILLGAAGLSVLLSVPIEKEDDSLLAENAPRGNTYLIYCNAVKLGCPDFGRAHSACKPDNRLSASDCLGG